MKADSKYYDQYYALVLKNKSTGNTFLDKALRIWADVTDRRGIKHEFNDVDADIQDEIIEKWMAILS